MQPDIGGQLPFTGFAIGGVKEQCPALATALLDPGDNIGGGVAIADTVHDDVETIVGKRHGQWRDRCRATSRVTRMLRSDAAAGSPFIRHLA